MRSLSKATYAIGIVAALALTASAAEARSGARYDRAYDAYDAYDSIGDPPARASVPYDAGGPAYTRGQGGLNSSGDFQLQGR